MSSARHGRRKPYTTIGVKRLPCCRCGKPAQSQWQICADKNLYRPICTECDIELNKLVLKWIHDPLVDQKIQRYKQKKLKGLQSISSEDMPVAFKQVLDKHLMEFL